MNNTPGNGAAEYDPRNASILLALLTGMALMVTYVETMVLPAFKQFFTFFNGQPISSIAWILSAYLLVGVVVTPLFSKLGDIYGKRRMLLIVMSVYAASVSVAGFTPNIGDLLGVSRFDDLYLLIAVRGIQGVGMAMFPLAFAMIPEYFPPARIGVAQGIISSMFAAGASVGLVGGGWLAQTYGWQFTYHTIIPVAVLLTILGGVYIAESKVRLAVPLDFPGVTSLGLALAMGLLGTTEGQYWGWSNFAAVHWNGLPWGVPQFFLLAAVFAAFFVVWELRAKNPVVSFARLKERNILVSNVNGIIVGCMMFLIFTVNTIFIEYPISPGFGQSEFTMGLLSLPAALGMLVAGFFTGRAVSSLGPKPMMALGFAVSAGGALGLLTVHTTIYWISLWTIPSLIGVVMVLISMTNVIILTADKRELGIQTGMNMTLRTLGSAVGPVLATAVLGVFLVHYLGNPFAPLVYSTGGFEAVYGTVLGISLLGLVLTSLLHNFRFLANGVRTTAPVGTPSGPLSIEAGPAVTTSSR